jgi:hypothetical protein
MRFVRINLTVGHAAVNVKKRQNDFVNIIAVLISRLVDKTSVSTSATSGFKSTDNV